MEKLKKEIKEFIRVRNWEQFHSPKNLAMALSVEASEVVEIFQWKETNDLLSESEKEMLKQEIGDILIYLLEIGDKFDIDIIEAAKYKLKLNDKKYPARLVYGKANKYTDYEWMFQTQKSRQIVLLIIEYG